jgi:hypothetical protein
VRQFRRLHLRRELRRLPLPPNIGAIVHRPWCRVRPCGSECTCVPERWQHVPGRIVLTIDEAGRVRKENCQ